VGGAQESTDSEPLACAVGAPSFDEGVCVEELSRRAPPTEPYEALAEARFEEAEKLRAAAERIERPVAPPEPDQWTWRQRERYAGELERWWMRRDRAIRRAEHA
jgi:hypothetical protein